MEKILTFLLLSIFPTVSAANVINQNETHAKNQIPPIHQVLAEFDQILKESGQQNNNNFLKISKTLLGASTAKINTTCTFGNLTGGLDQCEFTTTFLICYADYKCGCTDIDRILKDFEGKMEGYQEYIDGAVGVMKQLGVTLKTSYDADVRKCVGIEGSVCPKRRIDLPDYLRAFNDMKCQKDLPCSNKDIDNNIVKDYVGKCSGSSLLPFSSISILCLIFSRFL